MAFRRDLAKKILIYAALAVLCLAALWIVWSLGLDETTSLILTVIVLLLLPAAIVADYLMSRRRPQNIEAAPKEPEAEPAQPKGVYTELNSNADEAVKWMRDNMRDAKNGDALYSLPWYLVAGPHKSGKTSLLVSANLDYQKLSQLRAEENEVRPTRNCDWRITNSAVLIDTAGRYQNEGPGSDEWLAMIETLKRVRKQRPIDGLIIVISLARLLEASEQENETQARIMRDRLDELIARAQSQFPVYLVFTHTDTVEGFNEYFRSISPAQRGQVWGATFKLDEAQSSHAQFDVEFNKLFENLMMRRLHCLNAVSRPVEHLRIFLFPLRFRQFRRKVGTFVETLFRSNPLKQSPLLRGFYFAGASANSRQNAPGQAGAFAHDLFHRVLLRDRDVAAAWQSHQRQPRPWREAAAAAACLALLALTLGVIFSYLSNRDLIRRAAESGQAVERLVQENKQKDPSARTPNDIASELRALDDLRQQLVELDEYDKSRPFSLGFGLYSGDAIRPYLRNIYFEQVYQHLLKPTLPEIRQRLLGFVPGDPLNSQNAGEAISARDEYLGNYYDLLKAYLMLSKPARVEPTLLGQQLADNAKLPQTLTNDQIDQAKENLKYYAMQAADADAPHIRVTESEEEIVKARDNLIREYGPVKRIYKQLISQIKVEGVSLERILQGIGGGVLSGSYVVPGSHTLAGYREYTGKLREGVELVQQDDWVVGKGAAAISGTAFGEKELRALNDVYLADYVNHWSKFLEGVNVCEVTQNNERTVLYQLAESGSPLERTLKAVAEQTNLSATPSGKLIGSIKKIFAAKTNQPVGNNVVEREFNPVLKFISAESGAGWPQYREALNALSNDPIGADPIDPKVKDSDKRLVQTVQPLKAAATTPSQKTVALLMQPFDRMMKWRYGDVLVQLNDSWKRQTVSARDLEMKFQSCFPYNTAACPTVNTLDEFLNPTSGRLKDYFDRRAKSPRMFSAGFGGYLDSMARLQQTFYPAGSPAPVVGYYLEVKYGADQSSFAEIKVDGCVVSSMENGKNCTWPAATGQATGAQISLISADGKQQGESLKFTGEWGLFQMFARGNPRAISDDTYELSWGVEGTTVRATLKALRKPHPFRADLFRGMQAPSSVSN